MPQVECKMYHPCKQCSWWGCSLFSGALPQSWTFFQKEWDFLTCCRHQVELSGCMPEIRPWQRKPGESWWCPCLHPKIPRKSACFFQNHLWLLVESSRGFNYICVRRWKGRMNASLVLWVGMSRCYFFFVLNNDFGVRNLRGACVFVAGARQGWVVERSDGNVPGGLRRAIKFTLEWEQRNGRQERGWGKGQLNLTNVLLCKLC